MEPWAKSCLLYTSFLPTLLLSHRLLETCHYFLQNGIIENQFLAIHHRLYICGSQQLSRLQDYTCLLYTSFDIRDFCDGKIARYKIPKYIFFVDEFPMTGSGKIQKFKLKDVGLEPSSSAYKSREYG